MKFKLKSWKKPNSPSPSTLAESAKQSEALWNLLVPERNFSIKTPIFWVLLGTVTGLHFYNNYRDNQRSLSTSEESLAEQKKKENMNTLREMRKRQQIDADKEKV